MDENIYNNVTEAIGKTPLIRINHIIDPALATVLVKLEFQNPGGSVKDRIANAIIDAAVESGQLKPGGRIGEATSGNTGIGLAMCAAARGFRAVFTMPESMSKERRALLRAYGAELVLTPASDGMRGAVAKINELAEAGDLVLAHQFENEANPRVHYQTTGPEIWNDTAGAVDIVIAGIGTGGTITGAGKFLKEQNANISMIGVEPAESPILNGGAPGPHKIQGMGANFIPEILDRSIYDEVVDINIDQAVDWAHRAATEEGLMVGISSGATLAAAAEIAARPENLGKKIVVIAASNGERYLSTVLFEGITD